MALHGPGRRWKEAKEPKADLPHSHGQGVKALTVETGKVAFTDSICGPGFHTNATGVKSRMGSYGSCLKEMRLMAIPDVLVKRSV